MNPRLRTTLWTVGACVAAAFLGWKIAEGEYGLPALAGLAIVAAIVVRLSRLSADTILVGLLLIGYTVGNRGFAQLTPIAGVPLFPAEAVLLLALGWRVVVWSFARRLPCQRDALNFLVLAWLVLGTIRLAFDAPRFGLMAARDYAMIYYAIFFFIAQHMAREPRARAYLSGCLLAASLLLVPMYGLFYFFAPFFLTKLTVLGAPVIYYKGDLVTTSLGIGSILLFHWATGRQRFWAWPLAALMFVLVAAAENRSSLLAVFVAALVLLLARRWQFPALLAAVGVLGLTALFALSLLFDNPWAEQRLHGLGDRVSSIADVTGSGRYESQDSFNKGDNNRFRLVWWRNVAEETWHTNPVFGLGFGADLARGFLQEYYPDASDEFSTRSPHNILVTVFGRLGLVGVAVFGAFCCVLLRRTWHSLRHTEDRVHWSLWCAAIAILCSATFGVVLEGPMGAVLFWTLLGVANAGPAIAAPRPDTDTPTANTPLRPAAAAPA